MCGIVGAMTFDGADFTVSEDYIVSMRDAMAHRGPDGAGVWISPDRRVGLGHRRLSIIDLSPSAGQPMCNEDASLWVSFNGEIYNHAEIRRELEQLGGHSWKTDHSDTEVILHAFEQWGIDCVLRFRGMFAIALWDTRKKELWLIRDRIGIKPLYYSVHHGRLVFASEIKALLNDREQPRVINERGLFHFLSFLAVPAPETLFEGIKKLPGGTWIKVNSSGKMEEVRYWDVLDHTEPLIGVSEDEIAERLLDELRDAVRARKLSDVPVGVFLSGGMDSSTNTALFSEDGTDPVKTFSIGYEGEYESYQNELNYARLVAERFGADYHEKLLTIDDLIDFLPQMVYLQDEPIADPVCLPVYYVSRLAIENGIKVCQVGEGADELFCGYKYWNMMNKLQRLNALPVPRAVKKLGLGGLTLMNRTMGFDYEWLRRATLGVPVFWGGAESYTHLRKKRLVSPRLFERYSDVGSWESIAPIHKRFVTKAWDKTYLNWMTYLDLNNRLPELLLMRIDKMSMATSLEARVPFLDHKFVELALSIPSELKIKHGKGKYILRKAVRNTIPDVVIDRQKQGFGLPLHDWFQGHFGQFARQKLEAFCKETGFLNYEPIAEMLDMKRPAAAWPLLNLALWWDRFFSQSGHRLPTGGASRVAEDIGHVGF